MADTVLKNMRNIKHYDGNKWVRIKRQKIWLDGKIVRRTKTFSFWRLVCGKIPAKSIPRPPEVDKNEENNWHDLDPNLDHLNKLSSPIPGRFHMKFSFSWPFDFTHIHTHTHTHIHTHNLGSSEKLSPGEYSVLYPGKTWLFLPGVLAGN